VLRKASRRGLIATQQERQEIIIHIISPEWRMLLIGPSNVPAN
jgi:hypothetical protein